MSKENVPIIVSSCRVVFPEDEKDIESKQYLEECNSARVIFASKNADDELDPGIWILYLNTKTGEVLMPAAL